MLRYSCTALRHPSQMSAAFTSIGLKPKQASKSLKYEAELRKGIFWDFFPQTMQPSFDLITVSHEKQKERRTKTTLKARELTFSYIAIFLFIFFVGSVELKRGGKQTRTRALQAHISGYFH